MKLKKVLAAVLSAAMVVTSVVMPQGAARVAAAATETKKPEGLTLKDVLTLTFDGTSGTGTYTESGNEYTVKEGASIAVNPDNSEDATDKVLAVNATMANTESTKDKGWIASKAGILKGNDFSGGIVVSMDVRPTQQNTDWNYLFCVGQGADLKKNGGIDCGEAYNYVDGTIGFIARQGDPYVPHFPGDGWQEGNKVDSNANYFKDVAEAYNKWHNLTYVYTQGYVAIYVDGVLATKWTNGTPANILNGLTEGVLVLGGSVSPQFEHFTGYIDNVKVSIAKTPVESISLKDKLSLVKDATETLAAETLPAYANYDTAVTWESANDAIASVGETDGVVTAKSAGTTTITAKTAGGVTASCEVTVVGEAKPVTAVTATADKTTLNLKEKAAVTGGFEPADATGDTTIAYTSSDENILKVDGKTGEVTAVGAGTATVTAAIGQMKSDPVTFTVNDTTSISGGYSADWTRSYKVDDGAMLQFEVTDLKGGDSVWNNIIAYFSSKGTDGLSSPETANGQTGYAKIRGDNYDLLNDNKNTKYDGGVPDLKDQNFIAMMKDASGTLTVARKGETITFCFELEGNGKTCTRTATSSCKGATDLYVSFSVDSSSYTISRVHTWTQDSYTTEVTAPTCNDKGYTTYTDKTETSKMVKTDWVSSLGGHKFTKHEGTAATCTEAGKKDYWTCANEEGVFYADAEGTKITTESELIIPALGHKLTKTEAKPATCTEKGNKAYYTCSVCKKYFEDEEGKTETTLEATVEDLIAHTLVHHDAVAADCGAGKDGAVEYWECSSCNTKFNVGTDPKDENVITDITVPYKHQMTKVEKVEPNCGEEKNGCEAYYTCSGCGKNYKDEAGTEVIDDLADLAIPFEHKWVEDPEKTTATCTEAGTVTRECSVCHKKEEGTPVDKLGHKYGEWETTKEPTCTETGTRTRTCTRTGCTAETEGHIATETIPAAGHTYNEGEITTAPTCTETGVRTKTCTREGCTAETTGHTTTEVIPAKGHSIVKVNAKAATCTEAGNEEHYTCTDCNKKFEDAEGAREITDLTTIEIAALGHTYNEGEVTTAPTCTEAGVRTKTCTREGCTAETTGHTTTEVIPAKGHTLTKIAAKEATTSAPGNKEYYTCSECGKYFSDAEGTTEITLESTVIPKKTATQKDDTKVTLTLNIGSATLYTGKVANSAVIQAKVTGTSDAVTWNTSNVNVVKVVNGTLKAVGKGTATITAIVKGVSKTVSVTVKDPSIKVKKGKKAVSKVTVKRKKSVKLTVSVSPAKSGLSVAKLSKKDKKKVKVTLKNGKLTIKGKKKGKVTLKIKSGKAVKKIKVTVK